MRKETPSVITLLNLNKHKGLGVFAPLQKNYKKIVAFIVFCVIMKSLKHNTLSEDFKMAAKYILKRVEGENVTFHEVEFEQAIQRFAKVISEGQMIFANKAVELGVLESTEATEPTKEKKQEIGTFWEDWVEEHSDVKWCGEWNTRKTQRGVFGRITKSIAKLMEYVNAAHHNTGTKVEWSVLSKKDKLPEGVELIKSLRGY